MDGISALLLCLQSDAPYSAVVNKVILAHAKHPVARAVVAPVGVGNAFLLGIAVADVVDGECSRHVECQGLNVLWQRIEDHVEVKLADCGIAMPAFS